MTEKSSLANPQLESPLKQLKHGIPAKQISCNDGFELILKVEDKSAVCVTPSTVNTLIERGWGMMIMKKIESTGNFPSPALNSKSLSFAPEEKIAINDKALSILQEKLKRGDNVFLTTSDPTTVNSIRSSFKQGVNVYATFSSSKPSHFIAIVPTLPKGYDMFYLDFEESAKFSGSEFTTDQAQVFSIFDECKKAVNQYNSRTGSDAKFFATPVYKQITSKNPNFDWSLLPQHEDLVWIQFEQYTHSQGIGTVAGPVVKQIKATNNSVYVIVQISVNSKNNYTIQDAIEAMNELKDYPVDSFEVFAGPDVANLRSFLNIIQ